jgi:hypothetical protein
MESNETPQEQRSHLRAVENIASQDMHNISFMSSTSTSSHQSKKGDRKDEQKEVALAEYARLLDEKFEEANGNQPSTSASLGKEEKEEDDEVRKNVQAFLFPKKVEEEVRNPRLEENNIVQPERQAAGADANQANQINFDNVEAIAEDEEEDFEDEPYLEPIEYGEESDGEDGNQALLSIVMYGKHVNVPLDTLFAREEIDFAPNSIENAIRKIKNAALKNKPYPLSDDWTWKYDRCEFPSAIVSGWNESTKVNWDSAFCAAGLSDGMRNQAFCRGPDMEGFQKEWADMQSVMALALDEVGTRLRFILIKRRCIKCGISEERDRDKLCKKQINEFSKDACVIYINRLSSTRQILSDLIKSQIWAVNREGPKWLHVFVLCGRQGRCSVCV